MWKPLPATESIGPSHYSTARAPQLPRTLSLPPCRLLAPWRWERKLLPTKMEASTFAELCHSKYWIESVLWHKETQGLLIFWGLSKFSSKSTEKTTAMNRLEGKIKKSNTKLLVCLYPTSLALPMHQLHSFLLYTHYMRCAKISVSEMKKIRYNHHFTKLYSAEGTKNGSSLLLHPL